MTMVLAKIRSVRSLIVHARFSSGKSTQYSEDGIVVTITLNRPKRFNAIDEHMPGEIRAAVEAANSSKDVKVIVITGAGNSFCSGYDLKLFAEPARGHPCVQELPWDPYLDYSYMSYCNDCCMALWRSHKPTIAKIRGACVGGGSDVALLCDLTFASTTARIGYPPARLWGCPTSAIWAYRLGLERSKRILFQGKVLSGAEAAEMGLIGQAVPDDQLDECVQGYINSIKDVPVNQLFFQKQVINSIYESMGLLNAQRLATFIDGMTRHTPEGVQFQEDCQKHGFKYAVSKRDDHS